MKQCQGQMSLFSAEASRDLASHLVLPGSAEARRMTATSGRKCLELYKISGPLGSLARMLLGSSQWRSTRCYLTWKASVTPARRFLFRLVPSTPRIDGIDARLWPTVTAQDFKRRGPNSRQQGFPEAVRMWPTPTARDSKGANSREHLTRKDKRNHTDQLANAVMLATPTRRCWKETSQSETRQESPDLQTQVGGQLNPDWVEWLMGFPVGWTSLETFPESQPASRIE